MPPATRLDHLVLGGERFTLNGLMKECPALASMGDITLKTAAEHPRPET